MKLTKTQNSELDSLKEKILFIEKNINNAQCNLEIAIDLEDTAEIKKNENAIAFGLKEINNMVTIQSKTMKLEYNLVLDLIFDREYTLTLI